MTETVIDPVPSDTVQGTDVAPSVVIVTEPQAPPLQDTVTLPVCHAPQSAGPGEQLGCGVGGSAFVAELAKASVASVTKRARSGTPLRIMLALPWFARGRGG